MSIYYVHGFASCGQANSGKVSELAEMFPDEKVFALNYDSSGLYQNNLSLLISSVGADEEPYFVGSSLGGLYARVLADYYSVPCAVFNPVVYPATRLKSMIGENVNYCTGKIFLLTNEVVESYSAYIDNQSLHRNPTCVFLAMNDEIIDMKELVEYFERMAHVVVIDGGHRVASLNLYVKDIVNTRHSITL